MINDRDALLERIGKPVPCAVCRTPTPTSELTEVTVPGAVIFGGSVVVQSIEWLCPRCAMKPVP